MFGTFTTVRPLWDADDKGGGAASDEKKEEEDQAPLPGESKKFLDWLGTQPKDVQDLYEEQVHGLKSALKKERDAAAGVTGLKKKLSEYETKEEEIRKAQMSKEELLTSELAQTKAAADSAQQENQRLRLEFAVEREATKLRFVDPADALSLLDVKTLKINDQGQVEGLEEGLKALIKKKPYLVVAEKPASNGIGNKIDKRKTTREDERSTLIVPSRSKL